MTVCKCERCGKAYNNYIAPEFSADGKLILIPSYRKYLTEEGYCQECSSYRFRAQNKASTSAGNAQGAKYEICDKCGGRGKLGKLGSRMRCDECGGRGEFLDSDYLERETRRRLPRDYNKKKCFITTACITTVGLSDDCLELETLREFRDNVMLRTQQGRKEVESYYRLAPRIIAAISSRDESNRIWHGIYKDISTAVKLVLLKDFDNAYRHYKQMVSNLEDQFLV